MDCTVYGILQARILEWVAFSFSRGSCQPRDRTQVGIAGGFFTSWATREAQEYWSGSLSLLQGILLTQELNCGLLHCRRILYHLSYQGSLMVQYQAQVLIYLFRWIIRMTWLRQQKSTDFEPWLKELVTKVTKLPDALILATTPRCEDGSINLPNQFFSDAFKSKHSKTAS